MITVKYSRWKQGYVTNLKKRKKNKIQHHQQQQQNGSNIK